MTTRGIRVVLFDLDDTLFQHREAIDTGIIAYAKALGAPYRVTDESAEIAAWYELEERHYHRYLGGELDYEGQRRARARDFAARHGVELDDAAASAWYERFFEHYVAAWRLHDDALPCLDALRDRLPGVRLGLITNGDEAYQLRKIDQIALTSQVEHIVASGALGIVKPDARIFEHACALFEVEPSSAVYVGDRLRTDAIGAARAGLTGVWLDRRGRPVEPDDRAEAAELGVHRITRLAELPALLAG